MYICLCNALTDRDVHRALGEGVERVSQVYAACNCRAQCGACAHALLKAIRGVADSIEIGHDSPLGAPAATG